MKSKRRTPSAKPIFAAEFAIGSIVALAQELRKCVESLRNHWGIVDGQLPTPAQPAKLNLKGLFTNADYPKDAMFAEQTGTTTYLLMVDAKGKILDCLVKEGSGVASLDFMGCQVIKERAKGEPALDAAGKPTKSIFVARLQWDIRWFR